MMDALIGIFERNVFLENVHLKELSYWYLWKDQIEKMTQKDIMASLKNPFNKMEELKLDQEQKVKSTTYVTYLKIQPHLLIKFV